MKMNGAIANVDFIFALRVIKRTILVIAANKREYIIIAITPGNPKYKPDTANNFISPAPTPPLDISIQAKMIKPPTKKPIIEKRIMFNVSLGDKMQAIAMPIIRITINAIIKKLGIFFF